MKNRIKNKEIGVILTDTIYGIVGLALEKEVVERIYVLKKRNLKKPMIVLISSMADLKAIFDIDLNKDQMNILKDFWPGPVSIVLPCFKYDFLHRGTNSIAFRIPKDKKLISLIKDTGPLIATSVNIEGEDSASNIEEAKKCFSDKVDFYCDSGEAKKDSSLLIKLDKNNVEVLRGKICLKK